MNLSKTIKARRAAIIAGRQKSDSPMYRLFPELQWRELVASPLGPRGAAFPAGRAYGENQWVFRAINVRASALSSCPLRLQTPDGSTEELLEDRPNPVQSWKELWMAWAINLDLYGEAFIEIVPSRGGQPLQFWVRRPQDVTVQLAAGPQGEAYMMIAGYKLAHADGVLPPERVMRWAYYNPYNPVRGMSPIIAAQRSVSIDSSAQALAVAILERGARPDFAIIAPAGLTRSERDSYLEEFLERYAGVDKWSLPIILENGVVDIKPITIPDKDLAWQEKREMSRDEIMAVFGVPPELAGYGRATYENFRMAEETFWRLAMLPLIRFRDDGLTGFFRRYYPDMIGDRLFVSDTSGVKALHMSMADRIDLAERMWKLGVPYNEIAAALDLPVQDVPGGDVGWLPANMIPVTGGAAGRELAWDDYMEMGDGR